MCVQPWIPSWFSPTSPEPCLLHHPLLGSVLIRLPRSYLHSSPSCLHSSPSCSSPSRTHPPSRPPPHSESSSRSSNRLLCHLPPSAFPARPHTHSVSSYAGSVGVLYHPSLYTLVPLSRAREQCPRTQKEGGRWNLLFPPAPPGGARALCLPSALSGCA